MNRRKAARLRIYLDEDDQIGHRPAHVAVVELLRRERAAGATVLRGVEGFGATGIVHTVNLGDLVEKLPVVIEWVDTPEQIARLLPELEQMLPRGLVTLDETEVVIAAPSLDRAPAG
jgi:PII-like signaling protein